MTMPLLLFKGFNLILMSLSIPAGPGFWANTGPALYLHYHDEMYRANLGTLLYSYRMPPYINGKRNVKTYLLPTSSLILANKSSKGDPVAPTIRK